VLACLALAGVPWTAARIVPLEAALWHRILFWRGCSTDVVVEILVDAATVSMLLLLGAAAARAAQRDGATAAWPPLALCALGLLAGRALKNVFARARPSALTDLALGYSFPSGHVMNTALAGLAVVLLSSGLPGQRRWRAAAGICMSVIFAGRLLAARHWLLDAVAGLLAAVALAGLGHPWVRRRPVLAPAVLALALAIVLLAFLRRPDLRIVLPSPLTVSSATSVEIDIGAPATAPLMRGEWTDRGSERAGRSYVWLRGSASVDVPIAERALVAPAQATLAVGGRPDAAERRCARVRVGVNDTVSPAFVPFEGWREYRLPIPGGALRGGANEVRIEIADLRRPPPRFAVDYLRIDLP
jgi:membrane-associated phospholipid phosphatase